MKAKVKRNFINKYSKNLHKKGDVLDISKKRFEEINATSFGILVEEIKEKAVEEPGKDEKTKEGESTGATENEESKKSEEKKSTKK